MSRFFGSFKVSVTESRLHVFEIVSIDFPIASESRQHVCLTYQFSCDKSQL